MGKKLIIVESPAKVKSIRKFNLGAEYEVAACAGHVRDLPSGSLGVDEKNGFEPQYEIIPDKEKVVKELQAAARNAETVYLAPDPDREGEAIAYHIKSILQGRTKGDIKRIQFNEITPRAVKEALSHPRELNEDLFHAQQARRILDRLVGYKISPLLWKTVKRGISAGRVQSVALRLIVDRENERERFTPREYWLFHAQVQAADGTPFRLELVRVDGKKPDIGTAEEAAALEEKLRGRSFEVLSVEKRRRIRQPSAPFITSTLQQAANTRHGFSAKRTMGIAQRLYEGIEMKDGNVLALITYMRTDSTRIADEARQSASSFIGERFGSEYLPAEPRVYKARTSAQDAHEAVRPVDVTVTPDSVRDSLSEEQLTLYRLIWSRFVASQMADAVYSDTVVNVCCGSTEWQAKGERQLFDGWTRVLPREKEIILPEVRMEDDTLPLLSLEKEQKFTQPPARYSEATLVRMLEEQGIGRPSTYAAIISTLENREYVEKKDRFLMPTELGRVVCRQLMESFADLMDVGFTAGMESQLDRVAEGFEDWAELMTRFAGEFNPALSKAAKNMKSVKGGLETSLACPDCGKPLVIRFGKTGAFLSCQDYPDCKFSSNCARDEDGHLVIAPATVTVVGVCPQCGHNLVIKKTRTGGRFTGCSAYPECRYTEPLSSGVTCPQCRNGHLVEKSSRKGRIFYSCDRYPQCDYAIWNEPVPRPCPDCGSPYLLVRRTKQGAGLICPNKECGYTASLAGDGDAAGAESDV